MRGRRKQEDFAEELRSHLALEADQLRAEGLDAQEARRRAHLRLGNLMRQEEIFYESRRWAWIEQCVQDLRYTLRQLRQAPAFALTVVLTLALGIGATTSIFTLIHAVMLKSLPVSRPEQLYTVGDAKVPGVYTGMPGEWELFSLDLYRSLRDHVSGFEQLAAFQAQPRRVGVRRQGSSRAAESYVAEYVSGNYFGTLGVPVFAGRAISPEDDRDGAPPVGMIAYRVWQENYGLDPAVIGATFNVNGVPITIVGATPPGFFGETLRSDPPDFFLAMSTEPAVNRSNWSQNRNLHWLYLIGRIERGANRGALEAGMRGALQQWLIDGQSTLRASAAVQIPRQTLHLNPAGAGMGFMRTSYSTGLKLLMWISGFVLLIVCANVANLMLVRGWARRRQTSISIALGAARSRLVRQALTECVVLAVIGGAAGIALAFAGTRTLLSAVFSGAKYVPISASPELAVIAFAFTISMATGLIFGAVPAWSASQSDPIDALRGAGRGSQPTGALPQRVLVVLQAAVSLVLLVAAGLLSQSLLNLSHQRFGFVSDGRLAIRIDPLLAGYKPEQLETLYRGIRERLAPIPGVLGVTWSLYSPMSGNNWTTDIVIEGRPPASVDGENLCSWNRVGPGYFDAVGTRLVRGRPVLESDTEQTRHVAVVNEAFVQRFFPGEDPIGRHFGALIGFEKDMEIVGVAENAKYRQPDRPVVPMFFRPRPQVTHFTNLSTMAFESRSLYATDIILRLAPGVAPPADMIRRIFAEIDPNLPVIRVQTFDFALAGQYSQETLIARLASLFGLTALLLASIGIYGVTSYSVARRSKEIGIRVALGAGRRSVFGIVLRTSYTLVALGLLIGVPLALGLARFIGNMLYGVSWNSPAIVAAAGVVLAVCALIAVLAPARRAAAVDPVATLRGE